MSASPVVVITGASSGIGRATARLLAADRSRLVLAARGRPALEEVAEECRALGADALAVPTDVSVEEQVTALADAAIAAFGRIDVWIGAAGIFSFGSFDKTPPEVFRRIIETNLMGQVYGARAVLPHFRRQGGGAIVLVGSLFSRVTAPYLSPYVTSKFGVLGFGEVLRQELRAERGIRVRVVLPASIDTPIYQHAANYTGHDVHPLPPVASPQRVARAIVRSARRRRPVVVVGRVQGSFRLLHSAWPSGYDRVMRASIHTLGLRGRKPDATDGTVFTPTAAGENAVTGGWRSPLVRAVAVTAAVAAAGALAYRRGAS